MCLLSYMCDKSLTFLPFDIMRRRLSPSDCYEGKSFRVHFMHAVFTEDTCYLESAHKPVTLSGDLLVVGGFIISGAFCTLGVGWSSIFCPVTLHLAL